MFCEWDKKNDLIGYQLKREVIAQKLGVRSYNEADPDLQHIIRTEAASLYQPIHEANRQAQKNELSNNAEYDTDRTFKIDSDGHIVFTDNAFNGQRLMDIDTNARIYSNQYLPTDTITNLSLERAITQGASTIVTAYSRNRDANIDMPDHKDITVVEFNHQTGEGKMRMINTTTDGNLHLFGQIIEIASQGFSGFSLITPTPSTFLLTDIPIQSTIFKPIVEQVMISHQFEPAPKPILPQPILKETPAISAPLQPASEANKQKMPVEKIKKKVEKNHRPPLTLLAKKSQKHTHLPQP